MPDRDAGDVLDGDGLLVIGQRIHRHPADPPQASRPGTRSASAASGPIPAARPGTVTTPATRRTATSPAAPRPAPAPAARTPVPLQPQPRLGDPRPIRPAVPGPPPGLRRRHCPPRGPLIPGEPHRGQPLMHHIGPHLALGPVHPLLDLAHERVDQLGPRHRLRHRPAQIPGLRIPAHCFRIRLAQRRRRMRDPVASNASRISMISLSDFFTVPQGPSAGVSSQPPSQLPEGPQAMDRHVTVLSG